MPIQPSVRLQKQCFVTVGATADFDTLIHATLSPHFLNALKANGYTDLRLQHGRNGTEILEKHAASARANDCGGPEINISGFDFNKQGLGQEMRAVKGGDGALEGIVISHAGIASRLLYVLVLALNVKARFRLNP